MDSGSGDHITCRGNDIGFGEEKVLLLRIVAGIVAYILMIAPLYAVDFLPRVSLEVPGAAIGVEHGDFDGDGFMDVAVGNNSQFVISTFFGDSTGGLGSRTLTTNPGDITLGLVSGDFDRDGRTDLAFNNARNIAVVYGDPSRNYQDFTLYSTGSFTSDIETFDIDGDGYLDLMQVYDRRDGVAILYGKPDGTFMDVEFTEAGSRSRGVTAGDYNQDGFGDVVITNSDTQSFSVLYGTNQRDVFNIIDYSTNTSRPEAVVTADFNGDFIPDLAYTATTNSSIEVALGLDTGGFAPRLTFAVSERPNWIDTGDINGDGIMDLATSDFWGKQVAILIGVGDGTFTRIPDLLASATGSSRIDIADINADGFDDILVAAASGSYLDVFYVVPEPTSSTILLITGMTWIGRSRLSS